MKFKRITKRNFNQEKHYQLPFMKQIVVKSSDPRALETYNFI